MRKIRAVIHQGDVSGGHRQIAREGRSDLAEGPGADIDSGRRGYGDSQ